MAIQGIQSLVHLIVNSVNDLLLYFPLSFTNIVQTSLKEKPFENSLSLIVDNLDFLQDLHHKLPHSTDVTIFDLLFSYSFSLICQFSSDLLSVGSRYAFLPDFPFLHFIINIIIYLRICWLIRQRTSSLPLSLPSQLPFIV